MTSSTRIASRVRAAALLASAVAIAGCASGDAAPCAGASCAPVPDGSAAGGGGGSVATMDAGMPPEETVDAGCGPDGCPPADCEALACGDHRRCEETSRGPVCLDECEPGYELDGTGTACVACAEPDCGPSPTCDEGVPGSILDACDAAHRACVTTDGRAACGDCAAGYELDPATDGCVEPGGTCTEAACAGDELCQPGFALETDGETCSLCDDLSCGLAGEAPTVHDRRDRLGQCICETLSG